MLTVRCLGIMICLLPCSLTVRNEDREERNRRASYDFKTEENADFEERSVIPAFYWKRFSKTYTLFLC